MNKETFRPQDYGSEIASSYRFPDTTEVVICSGVIEIKGNKSADHVGEVCSVLNQLGFTIESIVPLREAIVIITIGGWTGL